MLKFIYKIKLTITIVIISKIVFSQTNEWRHYFAGSTVNCITKKNEYLWVGTNTGLVKINTITNEKQFFNKNSSPINSNNITSICFESSGILWIGTDNNGVICYDGTNWQFFKVDSSNLIIPSNTINSIYIDKSNNKWICTKNGLVKVTNGEWFIFNTNNSGLPSNYVTDIVEDIDHNLWITTYAGLVRYAYNNLWTIYNNQSSTSIDIDREGNLWIITSIEVVKFDRSSNWWHYNRSNSGLQSSVIYSVAIDSSNIKWIGTRDGVFAFDDYNWYKYDEDNSNLEDSRIISLYVDENNNKWIGTIYGGLYKFDGSSWSLIKTGNSPLISDYISSIIIDTRDNIWCGSGSWRIRGWMAKFDRQNWYIYDYKNSILPRNGISCIAIDKYGNKWIGTFGEGAFKFDGNSWTQFTPYNSGLSSFTILDIYIDNNNIYFGTWEGGLSVFNGVTWINYNPSNSGIPDSRVSAVKKDHNNNLWVGTVYNGVAKFDGTSWTVFNYLNSGINNFINCIEVDTLGQIWIGTSEGLARYDGVNWHLETIHQSHRINSITIDNAGILWIGTSNGFIKYNGIDWVVFDLSNSLLPSNYIMQIAIDKWNNKWIATANGLVLFKEDGINRIMTLLSSKAYYLDSNFPNPFNNETKISFSLPENAIVNLTIYNLNGEKIKEVLNKNLEKGIYEYNLNFASFSSGVYFYRINCLSPETGQIKFTASKKLIYIKPELCIRNFSNQPWISPTIL